MWLCYAWPNDSRRTGWQWPSFRYAHHRAKIRRHTVHYCWLLSRNTLIWNPQTSRGGAPNEDHEPQPRSHGVSLVNDWRLLDDFAWLCCHPLRTVHADSIAVGLYSQRHLLEPMDSGILCHCCWLYVIRVKWGTRLILTALSAIVDLYLAIYPAVVLYRLQMNVKKKIALSFALGLGSM